MPNKAAISLTTGLEDSEKVTVAFLVAVGAAEAGRPTLMFLTKKRSASPSTASPRGWPAEAVRLALDDVATGVACEGCPPLTDLLDRYTKAGGTLMVCPICFSAKGLNQASLVDQAGLGGSVQLWEWIGEGATTFSY